MEGKTNSFPLTELMLESTKSSHLMMSNVHDKFRRDSISLLFDNQWSRNLCIERKVSVTHQQEHLC